MNYIVKIVKTNYSNCGIMVGDILICILLYMDDIVLVADNEIDLQKMNNKLEIFCKQSSMFINISKTFWMIFEKQKSRSMKYVRMNFSQNHIAQVDQFKYLGTIFS